MYEYNGEKENFDTNIANKYDDSKIRVELIPPEFLWAVGEVLTYGANKYAAGNWARGEGISHSRLIGAAMRHIIAFHSGENDDPESGLPHLAHASCMLAFLIASRSRGCSFDDRIEVGAEDPFYEDE